MDNQPGVIYIRKRLGRKMRFMMGGPRFDEAAQYINWAQLPGNEIVVWVGVDGATQEVLPVDGSRTAWLVSKSYTPSRLRMQS